PKAKAGDAKGQEPKGVASLRAAGATFEMEGPAVVGVNLVGTRISDADLANLAGLKGLRTLDLTGTAAGDAGLAHLKGLTALTTTPVSDAGLAHFRQMNGLTSVELAGSQVSVKGAAALRKDRPDLRVGR